MHGITHEVDHYEIGVANDAMNRYEIGNVEIGEEVDGVGAEETARAVREVVRTARDNRQPAPKMRAVPAETPLDDAEVVLLDWFADVLVGVGEAIGAADPFPITTRFLQRFGAGQEKPRFVRVDTEESYRRFCAECSPEMAELRRQVSDLADRFEAHARDPEAHAALAEAIEEAEAVGAEVAQVEASKEVDLWLPEWARGKVRAWREGECVCASIYLPGADGELRICTSVTPVAQAVGEMEQHAADAGVSAAAIVGVIPAMGCVLGAGTLVKEMAAAAPAILRRPEAAKCEPFVCRIEPAASPALCALFALLCECKRGNKQACAEWDALASAAGRGAPHAARAMGEARDLFLGTRKAA